MSDMEWINLTEREMLIIRDALKWKIKYWEQIIEDEVYYHNTSQEWVKAWENEIQDINNLVEKID